MAEVLERLSDEEACLYALLSDPSGLDQAEFLWTDDSSEDNKFCPHCGTGKNDVHLAEHDELTSEEWVTKYAMASRCFRAWAFQWDWWRNPKSQQVDQCARCCLGDTLITLHDGSQRSIASLVGGNYEIASVDALGNACTEKTAEVYEVGVQQTYRLKARTGREISVTANHQFQTRDGWRTLCDLQVGDQIAVVRRNAVTSEWDEIESIEPDRVEMTYDIEMVGYPAFIANDIVVHNSVGKSLSIQLRACAFPFLFPGQEMVITAPELIHLEPVASLIETRLDSVRTLREMLPRGRGSVTHRPFMVSFLNGARIIGRIPQRDGRGVLGLHPIWLELDEGQSYPPACSPAQNETVKRGFAGAMWRVHGVTRGVRDDFYNITQDTPGNPWKVHRISAMWRPTWTNHERQQAIERYGSKDDPDYRRNVLGLHGDKSNPIFTSKSLFAAVDVDETSDYNTKEYFRVEGKSETLELYQQEMIDLLDFPASHLLYAGATIKDRLTAPKAQYWAGLDIGFTIDPSELVVCVEHRPKANSKTTVLKLLSRISMIRMPHHEQLKAILHTIDFYRPRVFAMDKAGNGLPLFQELQEHMDAYRRNDMEHLPVWMRGYDLQNALTTIKGYNFSEKLVVEFDQSIEVSEYATPEQIAAKTGMKRNAKEFATDTLRELVDAQRLLLPWDADLLKQFQGGTWSSTAGIDSYGRRTFSRGNDHVLDAFRNLALGFSLNQIEEMNKVEKFEPIFDTFLFDM